MQKSSKAPLSDRELEQVLHGDDDVEEFGRAVRLVKGGVHEGLRAEHVRDRIVKAMEIGLGEYHQGSCGPAAIAINRVLMQGKGLYVVAKLKRSWSGHVAVLYDGSLFDYMGTCDLNVMGSFVAAWREPFEIICGVREATITKYFVNRHTLPVDEAEIILRHTCEPYIHESRKWTTAKLRKHVLLEIAELREAQIERVAKRVGKRPIRRKARRR